MLVEITAALGFAFLWRHYGATLQAVTAAIATLWLLAILVIDLEHRLILNRIVLPGILFGLAISPVRFDHLAPERAFLIAITGAVVGWLLVLGIYWLGGVIAEALARARGRTLSEVAFGLGDVRLAGMMGALVGLPLVFQSLFVTVLLGGVGALGVLLYNLVVRRRYDAFAVMPYGPYFVISTWLFMIWGAGVLFFLG